MGKTDPVIVLADAGPSIRAGRLKYRTTDEILAMLDSIPHQTSLHIRPSLLETVRNKALEQWGKKEG